MTEFTITHPIRMDALYPEARIGDLFAATHDRHPTEMVVLLEDSCGQATFTSEFGTPGCASRQFGPEWTLQHVGYSWVTDHLSAQRRYGDSSDPARVAERVLSARAPDGHQPSFAAAFWAGVRYTRALRSGQS